MKDGDQKFGLTVSEMPIRYPTGELNYISILRVATLCSLLSYATCIISLIGKGCLFKYVIQ